MCERMRSQMDHLSAPRLSQGGLERLFQYWKANLLRVVVEASPNWSCLFIFTETFITEQVSEDCRLRSPAHLQAGHRLPPVPLRALVVVALLSHLLCQNKPVLVGRTNYSPAIHFLPELRVTGVGWSPYGEGRATPWASRQLITLCEEAGEPM